MHTNTRMSPVNGAFTRTNGTLSRANGALERVNGALKQAFSCSGGVIRGLGGIGAAMTVLFVGATPARGQCIGGGEWQPIATNGPASLPLMVFALQPWDPDGLGPNPQVLVALGTFSQAGGQPARGLAVWDGSTWQPFAGGIGGAYSVSSMTVDRNNHLIVGGNFTHAGGDANTPGAIAVNNIARYDGTAWHALGEGVYFQQPLGGDAHSLATLPNGDVVVGGWPLDTAGGQSVFSVARWDGSNWHAMGEGLSMPYGLWQNRTPVIDLHVLSDGRLVSGGGCTYSGLTQLHQVAVWDGFGWNRPDPIGPAADFTWPGHLSSVWAAEQLHDGRIVAAGYGANNENTVYAWSGLDWEPLPGLTGGRIEDLLVLPNGDLIAGGAEFFVHGIESNIARWDGATWHSMSRSDRTGGFLTLAWYQGEVVAAGGFSNVWAENTLGWGRWRPGGTCIPPTCDSIDFNNDTSVFDPIDIDAFLSVYGEGPCIPEEATCSDIDFNNDTSLFDPCDIDSFLLMYSEGPCTPCGQ